MWDLIVSVPDHCLSFYFKVTSLCTDLLSILYNGVHPMCNSSALCVTFSSVSTVSNQNRCRRDGYGAMLTTSSQSQR